MPSIQDAVNAAAGTTGLSVQDAANTFASTTGLSFQGAIKAVFDADPPSTLPAGWTISTQDHLNLINGTPMTTSIQDSLNAV